MDIDIHGEKYDSKSILFTASVLEDAVEEILEAVRKTNPRNDDVQKTTRTVSRLFFDNVHLLRKKIKSY